MRHFSLRTTAIVVLAGAAGSGATPALAEDWPATPATNPLVIPLEHPWTSGETRGGIFAHDCTADGRLDFVLTSPGRVSVYDQSGSLVWSVESAIHLDSTGGFPGIHHPGVAAGDIDADGKPELAWVTNQGMLEIRDATTGELRTSYESPSAQVALIANLRGQGDADAVLQIGQGELRAVRLDTGEALWHARDWIGPEHCPPRIVDLDHDGIDEICGPIILHGKDGSVAHSWNLKRDRGTAMMSFDSIVVADVMPGGSLEVALAEQGGNNEAILVAPESILWGTFNQPPPIGECSREVDPDKLAVGDFDPKLEGLEIFCRSACGRAPWVLDARGTRVATWNVSDTAPPGWFVGGPDGPEGSDGGLEEVVAIDWNGNGRQLVLAKERHVEGDAAVIDPINGQFVRVFPSRAARAYAADIFGDHREEVILVESADASGAGWAIRIFANDDAAPPPPARERRWASQDYRRQKQNWNYYSP